MRRGLWIVVGLLFVAGCNRTGDVACAPADQATIDAIPGAEQVLFEVPMVLSVPARDQVPRPSGPESTFPDTVFAARVSSGIGVWGLSADHDLVMPLNSAAQHTPGFEDMLVKEGTPTDTMRDAAAKLDHVATAVGCVGAHFDRGTESN